MSSSYLEDFFLSAWPLTENTFFLLLCRLPMLRVILFFFNFFLSFPKFMAQFCLSAHMSYSCVYSCFFFLSLYISFSLYLYLSLFYGQFVQFFLFPQTFFNTFLFGILIHSWNVSIWGVKFHKIFSSIYCIFNWFYSFGSSIW